MSADGFFSSPVSLLFCVEVLWVYIVLCGFALQAHIIFQKCHWLLEREGGISLLAEENKI